MSSESENYKFPFRGISLEKYYTEKDPKFYQKIEEISECWRDEFENGNVHAVAELLREGGPAFFHVPWIIEQIRLWEEKGDEESLARLEEIEEIVTDKSHGIGSKRPFGEKTVMLKEYDTYYHRYSSLCTKRRRICGDCPRIQEDPFIVSCFQDCCFPDRFEKLREISEGAPRMEPLFRHPPCLKALRLAVLDAEIFKMKN
jgi:hypothetical protein